MDELLKERYDLAKDRIVEICTETTVKPDFLDFFQNMAAFLEKTAVILERDEEKFSIEELQKENTELYKELFPQNYTHCYGNPAYAEEKLGEYGRAFTFLYAELRGAIAYAYEKKIWDYTVTAELFLEVYAAFENGELPSVKNVEDMLRSYVNDYCQDMMEQNHQYQQQLKEIKHQQEVIDAFLRQPPRRGEAGHAAAEDDDAGEIGRAHV